ncbi:hypothetical protein LP420_11340 [Massilia sp. B-10]|nr:hypothetical protein LP420_11340 [Massilia sp. B-10]
MYALARLLQKHARLFAVLETLDNGKTIRETRDADLPLAARHFYHHVAGPSCSRKNSPTTAPWAWWARSFPGTSRC